MQSKSMRSVHLSSPMEQAIHQMRTLLQRVSAIEGATSRRPALPSTPLDKVEPPVLCLQGPRGGT